MSISMLSCVLKMYYSISNFEKGYVLFMCVFVYILNVLFCTSLQIVMYYYYVSCAECITQFQNLENIVFVFMVFLGFCSFIKTLFISDR